MAGSSHVVLEVLARYCAQPRAKFWCPLFTHGAPFVRRVRTLARAALVPLPLSPPTRPPRRRPEMTLGALPPPLAMEAWPRLPLSSPAQALASPLAALQPTSAVLVAPASSGGPALPAPGEPFSPAALAGLGATLKQQALFLVDMAQSLKAFASTASNA